MKGLLFRFLLGLLGGGTCALTSIVALFALWNDYWIVTLVALPVVLIVAHVSLLFLSNYEGLSTPALWHGPLYYICGLLICFPLFFVLAFLVQTFLDNNIPEAAFWTVYGLFIGVVGMALLSIYARFLAGRITRP